MIRISHSFRISDNIVLLYANGKYLVGKTKNILNDKNLSELYGIRVRIAEIKGRKILILAR